MGLSIFRRKLLEQIVSECGKACHYCHKETRIQYVEGRLGPDHATLDHIVPKSKGGTNDRANLVLACNACNNAKGDRSYDDFLARPYRLRPAPAAPQPGDDRPVRIRYGNRVIVPVCKRKKATVEHPAYKAAKGTLAHAIKTGEVHDSGVYVRTRPQDLVPEPRNRIEPVPYHETMYILTGKKVPKRSEIFDPR